MERRRTAAPIQRKLGEEIELIYRSQFDKLLAVTSAITGESESGYDAVQDGFARALRYADTYRGEARLSTWVWSCVLNAAKALKNENERSDHDSLEADNLYGIDLGPEIETSVLAGLSDRQKALLFLRYYVDMDYREIARVMGISVGTVGATLHKAKKTIRHRLRERADEDETKR